MPQHVETIVCPGQVAVRIQNLIAAFPEGSGRVLAADLDVRDRAAPVVDHGCQLVLGMTG